MTQVIWRHPDWTPAEAPKMPGGPALIERSRSTRLLYAAIAILCGLTGTLGNALISSNLAHIQGNLSLTPVEGQWLLAAYVMVNCWANLVLFKFRMQFGVQVFAVCGLTAYATVCAVQVFVSSYEAALIARAASGLVAAPLTSLTIYYFIQAAGPKTQTLGPFAGLSVTQVVAPLAFVLVAPMNDLGQQGLQYTFECGLALCTLAAVVVFPLPHGALTKVFEWRDAVAIGLLAPGLALLVAALSQGRGQWWTDTPWIGAALAASLVLVIAGLAWEHYRSDPLIATRWLSRGDMLFFILGLLLFRLVNNEQQIAAVGFLRSVGTGPDQFVSLFAAIGISALGGVITALVFGTPASAARLVLVAVALILAACLLDRDTTPQDRIEQFYLSQSLIGFASGLSIGPLLLIGFSKVMAQGVQYMTSLIVVFAFTQSIGLLLSGALLNTVQLSLEHTASAAVTASIDPTNPIVRERLAQSARGYAPVITDPSLRNAAATSQLAQSATVNANTIAYNNLFTLLAGLAAGYMIMIVIRMTVAAQTARRKGIST